MAGCASEWQNGVGGYPRHAGIVPLKKGVILRQKRNQIILVCFLGTFIIIQYKGYWAQQGNVNAKSEWLGNISEWEARGIIWSLN